MDMDSAGIDEAAADPPVKWLAAAVAGLLLTAVGVAALLAGLVGLRGTVVGSLPFLGLVFDLAVPLLVIGAGVFVVSMTEWDPDVGR